MQLSGQSLSCDRCDVRMASRIAPSAAMGANHHMRFTVGYSIRDCGQARRQDFAGGGAKNHKLGVNF